MCIRDRFRLIPILDWETGEIAGYGKKDSIFGCCKNGSYSKEGEKEWITIDDLGDLIGRKSAARWLANYPIRTRPAETFCRRRFECEITECMIALFLFPRPPLPPKRYGNAQRQQRGTVCVHALLDYLERIGCRDKIDVYLT